MPGSVTLPAGATSVTIEVPVIKDSVRESDESFTLVLEEGALPPYTAVTTAIGTILNDDNTIATWDFSNAADYTFDPAFIDLTSGNSAQLLKVNTTFDSAATFNLGQHFGTAFTGGNLTFDYSPTMGSGFALHSDWLPRKSRIVALWNFENGTTDSSGQGLDLTPSAADVRVGTYPLGGVYHADFNGTRYASTSSVAIDFTKGMALSAWVRVTTSTLNRPIVQKGDGDHVPLSLTMIAGNRLRCTMRNSPGSLDVVEPSASREYMQNWIHAACVYDPDADTLSIYTDGVLKASAAVGFAPTSTASVINMGRLGASGSGLTGAVDEVAIWNTPLTDAEVKSLYELRKSHRANLYQSPIIDMGYAATPWPNMDIKTPLPYGKQLPPNTQSEAGSYSELIGSPPADLAGYWKFDELGWNGTADEVKDSSGVLNHGVNSGAMVRDFSMVGRAAYFNANSQAILAGSGQSILSANNQPFTVSFWVNPASSGAGTVSIPNPVISFPGEGGTNTVAIGYCDTGKICVYNKRDNSYTALSSFGMLMNYWYHIVVTYDGTCFRLGGSGTCVTKSTEAAIASPIKIGATYGTINSFRGYIDEVAVWKRALSDDEIAQLYRRTAQRTSYQARSCIEATCSCESFNNSPVGSATDCDGDGIINDLDISDAYQSKWLGPDGGPGSFFSELHNNTNLLATFPNIGRPNGDAQGTPLNIDWTTPHFHASAKPGNKRYFQFRVLLESDETSATFHPRVTSLTVGPAGNRYYGGRPSIVNNTSLSALELLAMTRVDSGSCTTYQISEDNGVTWLWWNGSAWTPTVEGAIRSNYLSDFTEARLKLLGSVSFKFKAFLSTNITGDFSESCELSKVEVPYNP